MKDKILLFIPMYNCEKQITRVLKQLQNEEVQSYLTEIIVVNNRSTDNGEERVKEYIENNNFKCKVTLLRNKDNYGLGGSHKVAFKYAEENNYDYIIVMHGDDQAEVLDLIPLLKEETYKKFDSLLGARFMKDSKLPGYSKFRTFGNRVYNILFSIGVRKRIYDLGSGLNMYNVNSLKSEYYKKFPDNLVFNYCMIFAINYYNQNVHFFPITWKEEDQVSNVKMFKQATKVLKLLGSYMISHKKFMNKEHREKVIEKYESDIIKTNR